jgi:hypothetical protein
MHLLCTTAHTGGRNCSKENPAKQKGRNAIPGLHSSWVGDKVLAMARPWQQHVVHHNLPAAFAQHNIGMILNLQEVSSTRLLVRMQMQTQHGLCKPVQMLPLPPGPATPFLHLNTNPVPATVQDMGVSRQGVAAMPMPWLLAGGRACRVRPWQRAHQRLHL